MLERIRRVVRANMNDMLDRVDTPEMAVEAKVDELQRALAEARRALAGFSVAHKRLEADRATLEKRHQDLGRRAEGAMRGGDESTARELMTERIRAEKRLAEVQPAAEKSAATHAEMKETLIELSEQLRAARAKLAELRSRKQTAEARQAAGEKLDLARGAATEAGLFDRLEEGVAATETDLEIQEEIRAELGGLDRKLEEPDAEAHLDEEMAALKKKVGGEA